jgi:biopolymer transport protein ExbD
MNIPSGGSPYDFDPLAQRGLLAEINVTPFIDVMLVLLIIFMVAAPLMMVGVPLKLPKTSAQTVAQPTKPIVVSIDHDGRVFVADQPVDAEQVGASLAPLLEKGGDTAVYVRADRSLDYGKVMDLLGKLGQGGASRLSLIAEGQGTVSHESLK